jgi:hypothetical protein
MNLKINDGRIDPPTAESPTAKASAVRATGESDGVQGEGNYAAARAFNDAERKFVASGKVAAAARAAAPRTEAERLSMLEAERVGKTRATGEPATPPPSAKATPSLRTQRTPK